MKIDIRQQISDNWLAVVLVVVLIFFLLKQNKLLINQMTKNIGRKWLNPEETIEIYDLYIDHHITEKIKYVKKILDRNSIQKRKVEIQKNIISQFDTLTNDLCNKLSKFNTPAWDLGKIIKDNLEADAFYDGIFKIVFSDSTNENKLNDLRLYLNSFRTIFMEKAQKKI